MNFSIAPQLVENRGIVASQGDIHEDVLNAIAVNIAANDSNDPEPPAL